MDIGLREWLIIGGILVIGLIIFDGWRRMKGQRNTLKIDIDRSLSDAVESAPSADAHNPELPNGGARAQAGMQSNAYGSESVNEYVTDVAASAARIDPGFEHLNDYLDTDSLGHTHQSHDETPNVDVPKKATESVVAERVELDPLFDDIPEILSPVRRVVVEEVVEDTAEKGKKKLQQPSEFFDLEQPITVLMRQASEKHEESSVSETAQEDMFFYAEACEADKSEADSIEDSTAATSDLSVTDDHYSTDSDISVMHDDVKSEDITSFAADSGVKVFDTPENERQEELEGAQTSSDQLVESEASSTTSLSEQDSLFENDASFEKDQLEHARSDRKAREHAPEPEEVLVITVVGKQQPLQGQMLLQVVLACGMRFGDMSLFHRFEEGIDKGAVQFSMANAVNPGTFDLEHMDEMTTPGVSFFMSMGEPADVKNAFECMLATAETVSKHLGGDLLDENRSVMRPQTKAHYRERIREYEMHNLHRRK